MRLTVVNSLPQADSYRSTRLPSLLAGVSVASSLLRVQSQLTTRDLVLLGWLADHRLLTTFQIATALFPSLDYAQERLRTLYRLAVVDRFRPQRPDGGSYPYHYVLAQLGDDVVAAQRGDDLPRRDRARRRREHLTSRANLPHLLGVNTFFTDLAGYARTHPHANLVRWWSAATCQQMGAFADDGDDIHVRTYTPTSRPDGHGIYTEHGHQVPFFLEYDTGTERPMSRLVDKLDGYHAWPASPVAYGRCCSGCTPPNAKPTCTKPSPATAPATRSRPPPATNPATTTPPEPSGGSTACPDDGYASPNSARTRHDQRTRTNGQPNHSPPAALSQANAPTPPRTKP
jgi:hypothetical protein